MVLASEDSGKLVARDYGTGSLDYQSSKSAASFLFSC